MPKTELERTCKRCDTVWYAQPETTPTIGRQTGTGRWASLKTPLAGKKRAELNRRRADLEADRARIAERQQAAGQCPQCGSAAYDERQVPVT
jgi:RNA polymerase subunit RPABC4/transcription elongation factor Spt4